MARLVREIPHQESVRPGFPPELFGAAKGLGRLGSWALPSETITFTSMAAMLILFGILSFSEATRFFFRLTFSSTWFSGPALAFGLMVAWRSSRRPGPVLPRVWILSLSILNLGLLIVGGYIKYADNIPSYLSDPFPLHALALSGAIAASVLLPRLIPMHPLKALVQTIAPLALATVLAPTIPLCIWFLESQMTKEQETLTSMSDNIAAAATSLSSAAHFSYSDPDVLHDFATHQDRIDAALAGLRLDPSALNLPDERRWKAAAILEDEGRMERGRLELAVRDLIAAVRLVILTDDIPELRTGRYFSLGRDATRYILNDEWARIRRDRPMFGPPVEMAIAYYSNAAKWLARISMFSNSEVSQYLRNAQKEIQERITELQGRGSTFWWTSLLQARQHGVTQPLPNMATVLRTPIETGINGFADIHYWRTLPWGKRSALSRGPCRVQSEIYDSRRILAPVENLSEEQRATGETYYLGEMYNASGMIQCFDYDSSVASSLANPSELVVLELRLKYEVHDLETRGSYPCLDRCWPAARMPTGTLPSKMELLVDIPPSALNRDAYPNELEQAFLQSVAVASEGDATVRLSHEIVTQRDDQRVVVLKILER